MKTKPKKTKGLAEKIDATDVKLKVLNKEVESISEPASNCLKHRLAAVEIEEHALQRNFAEVCQSKKQDKKLVIQVETLLHHIESEESAIEHEAEFLGQGAPSTLEFAYLIGSRIYNAGASRIQRVKGDHHFLPRCSPFVNTSIRSLDRIRKQVDNTTSGEGEERGK